MKKDISNLLMNLFGPVSKEIGQDIKKRYITSRNERILNNSKKKIKNLKDNKSANPRVVCEILMNESPVIDEVCIEYFGGILASSRTNDGNNDDVINFVSLVKTMSSKQLRLHYYIYNYLNEWLSSNNISVNVAQGKEMESIPVIFATHELTDKFNININTDLNVLCRQGLIQSYSVSRIKNNNKYTPYAIVHPTTFGVLLYSCALNRFHDYLNFNKECFGSSDELQLPYYFSDNLDKLISMTNEDNYLHVNNTANEEFQLARPDLGEVIRILPKTQEAFTGKINGMVNIYGICEKGKGGDSYNANVYYINEKYDFNLILHLLNGNSTTFTCKNIISEIDNLCDKFGYILDQKWFDLAVKTYPDEIEKVLKFIKSCDESKKYIY